jgi:DNA-binding CsgD family transcriptional regulator
VGDRALLDAMISSAIVIDPEGTILLANRTWCETARQNLMTHPSFGVGLNYIDTCHKATGPWRDYARNVAGGLTAVLAGDTPHFIYIYPCPDKDGFPEWFELIAGPIHHDGKLVGALVQHVDISRRDRSKMETLTPRERAILAGVVAGLSNKEIARRDDVSESAVKFHLHKIYPKLGVSNRAQAALAGERMMIVGHDDMPMPGGS